jgi:hypothetical protein
MDLRLGRRQKRQDEVHAGIEGSIDYNETNWIVLVKEAIGPVSKKACRRAAQQLSLS